MVALAGASMTAVPEARSTLTSLRPTTRWLLLKEWVVEEGATRDAPVTLMEVLPTSDLNLTVICAP